MTTFKGNFPHHLWSNFRYNVFPLRINLAHLIFNLFWGCVQCHLEKLSRL
jgi:hypothetical protein